MASDRSAMDGTSRRNLLKLGAFLGVALVAPTARAVAAISAPWDAANRALVAEVAEIIIPATDTGGAKAAGVPAFVEMMVSDWFDAGERTHFMDGIAAFAGRAQARYAKPFVALGEAEKIAFYGEELNAAASAAPSAGGRPRTPFAVLMKRLTIYGYYTSELGATVELSSNMVPNEYLPDAPFKPGDRADSFILYSLSPFSAF